MLLFFTISGYDEIKKPSYAEIDLEFSVKLAVN